MLTYHQSFSEGIPSKFQKILARLNDNDSILEVGCHTGYFTKLLLKNGYTVEGLEINNAAVSVANADNLPVRLGDIESEETRAGLRRYEVILLMDVLEHLRHPQEILSGLKRALKPNGKILVTGPNVAYWAMRKDLLKGTWQYRDAGILDRTHLHFYTATTWVQLLEESGFRATHLAAADGMLPLEQYLTRIPGIKSWVPHVRNWLLRHFPTVFAIDFLIEATPIT